MIKIPENHPVTSPLTNQKKVMHPAALPTNVAFKNPSLKAIREFGSFEHEMLVLLSGPCNKCCTLLHPTWCQLIGFATWWASGPKFGLVTKVKIFVVITNRAMKVEMTKDAYGLNLLVTNFPESWHSQTKRCSEFQSIKLAAKCTLVSVCTFRMAEMRESFLTGQ